MKILHLPIIAILLLSIMSVLPSVQGITGLVMFMKTNSTARIYADYTFRVPSNETWTLNPEIFTSMTDPSSQAKSITIAASPSSFTANTNHTKVVFTITDKDDSKGLYSLSLYFCGLSPLVVGLNESKVDPVTLKEFFTATYNCPVETASTPVMDILGYSGIISKLIAVNANNTIMVYQQNMSSPNNSYQPPMPPLPPVALNQSLQLPPPPPALHIPVYLSPLDQFKTGTAANKIQCNDGLQLVVKSEDGSPACVKLDTAYMLIKRGWAASESAYPGGDAQFALNTNSTIIPAHLPRSSGVQLPYQESSRVINYSGFDGVYNETFSYRGTQKDYVLKPGSTGVIAFKIDAMASEQQGQHYPIPLPKYLNRTNYALFYHEITSLEDLSKYPGVTFNDNGYFRACSTGPPDGDPCIGGPFGGTNPIDAFETDHPGVDVLFEPPSEVLPLGMNTTSQVVTMMITADSNAPRGTYLVELPSIDVDSFLLTVGNQPYHE